MKVQVKEVTRNQEELKFQYTSLCDDFNNLKMTQIPLPPKPNIQTNSEELNKSELKGLKLGQVNPVQ